MQRNPSPNFKLSGKFSEPGTEPTWAVEAWFLDSAANVSPPTQLLQKAIADIQRVERREARRNVCNLLFSGARKTYRLRVARLGNGTTTWLFNCDIQLTGTITDVNTQARLDPHKQAELLAKFLAFQFYIVEGKKLLPRSKLWQYAIAGYDAQFFWANAVLAKYCDFWGID